jgi:hypothetical protein
MFYYIVGRETHKTPDGLYPSGFACLFRLTVGTFWAHGSWVKTEDISNERP